MRFGAGIRFALALLCLPASVTARAADPPYAPATADRIVYRHATLIDGTGAPARRDMAVITRGPLIEAVVADAALTARQREDAVTVDLTGRYLLPGLIDSHQHLATPPNRARAEALMRRDLYSGITATRIMADDLRSIAELDRAAGVGEIAGPDLYFAAVVAGDDFFDDPRTLAISGGGLTPGRTPWAQAIDARTDIPLAIAIARGTGATALKIYAELPADLVRRLTLEAHRQGFLVWAHAMVFPALPSEVIAAGPDTVSHTCYLAYQAVRRPPLSYRDRAPIDPAPFANGDNAVMAGLFSAMRERGIILDATLRVYGELERRTAAGRERPHCTLDLAARLTAQAHRAGVLISAGTDGDTALTAAWPALFEELELLVHRAGLTPLEAIRSATQIGAMTMGQGRNMGVIAPAFVANLVVLERDPTADIANLRSALFTVKRGRRLDRGDYRPAAPAEAGNDD
jgi:imidazolonepropionase-like amidohydrolase